jgi:putative sugar O-methyltransferase
MNRIFDLSSNRAPSVAELERCGELVEQLRRLAVSGEDARWITPDGVPIHGGLTPYSLTSFDAEFVRTLRLHSYIFTAYHLRDVLTGQKTPSWTDQVVPLMDGVWPDWSALAYLRYREELPPAYFVMPPLVAGEVGFNVFGSCVNRDLIAYLERINLMWRAGILDRLQRLEQPRILEIGGGYGALAYALTRILPDAQYVIVDLPSSLMHAGCYLNVAQSSHTLSASDGRAPAPPRAIELVPNTSAAGLGGRQFDLAINTASFSEMPASVVRDYGMLIRDTLADGAQLFEQNVDLSGAEHGNFCSPSQLLAELFPGRRDLPAPPMTIWGEARLWSRQPLSE